MIVNLQRQADFRGGWGVLSLAQSSQAVVVGGVRGGLPLGFERLEGFDELRPASTRPEAMLASADSIYFHTVITLYLVN